MEDQRWGPYIGGKLPKQLKAKYPFYPANMDRTLIMLKEYKNDGRVGWNLFLLLFGPYPMKLSNVSL